MTKKIMLLTLVLMILAAVCLTAGGTQEKETAPAVSEETGELTSWPHKSLTVIVPYNAGGTNDRQARALAPYIQKELGVPIKVENRPGGSTTVAYHTHKDNDPADGSYILYGHHSAFSTAVIRGEYEYEEFDPLGSMSTGHPVLMVNPKHSDITSFKEFLQKVKERPNHYSQPVGPGWGRVFDMILQREGLVSRAIPVDGGSSDRVMFLAGDIDFYISDYESNLAIMDPEEYKVLTVLSEVSPYDQFVPANEVMKELGYSETFPNMVTPRYFQAKSEFKEQYPERFDFLAKVLQKAGQNPEFQKKMKDAGYYFNPELPEVAAPKLYDFYQGIKKYKEAF